jgi:hypothetical protein
LQLSFIFKCLCNAVILDDFKVALDRIRAYRLRASVCDMTPVAGRHNRDPDARRSGMRRVTATSSAEGGLVGDDADGEGRDLERAYS